MKLAVSIVLGAGVLAVGACQEQPSAPSSTATEESEQHSTGSEREREPRTDARVAEVLGTEDPDLVAAAEDFVRRLGEGLRALDRDALSDLVAVDRMVAYLERAGFAHFESADPLLQMMTRVGLKAEMSELLLTSAPLMAFEEDARVVRVDEFGPGEMTVYFRATQTATGVPTKWRFWLVREDDGAWRVFDYEDLDFGMRVTILMGLTFSQGLADVPDWIVDFGELTQVVSALADPAGRDAALAGIPEPATALLAHELPPKIETYARIMIAVQKFASGDWAGVLDEADRVDEIHGDAPVLERLRGRAAAALGRYDEALAAYGDYAARLGWDARLHESVANSHFRAGDRASAASHAEAGLALAPDAYSCLSILALSVPADGRDEVIQRVRALDDPQTGYAWILEFAKTREETDAYATYRAALAEDHPDSTWLETYG